MSMSKNLKAFLDALAWSEGTSISPATQNNGYDVIVTGVDGKPEVFADYSDHPFNKGRPSKQINSKGLTSNASGRYQFMLKDWAYYRSQLGLSDFGPDSQDKWAIQLIKEQKALPDIEAGNILSAINKCQNIWASLPGAGYGQHENKMDDLITKYKEAGGSVT